LKEVSASRFRVSSEVSSSLFICGLVDKDFNFCERQGFTFTLGRI
jgi:hypothetical protein